MDRSNVSAPPMAISEVEAKKAVPFCSAAMICMSTMRMSRSSIRRIHISRYASMRELSPFRPWRLHSIVAA